MADFYPTAMIPLEPPERKYRRVMGASTLISDSVQNGAGETIGAVAEIMLDTRTGKIAYAVLSFGGFLGFGDKLFAVPWSRLFPDEDRRAILLDVDRAALERAPGFDKNNWPDIADGEWESRIYSYNGSKSKGEETR